MMAHYANEIAKSQLSVVIRQPFRWYDYPLFALDQRKTRRQSGAGRSFTPHIAPDATALIAKARHPLFLLCSTSESGGRPKS